MIKFPDVRYVLLHGVEASQYGDTLQCVPYFTCAIRHMLTHHTFGNNVTDLVLTVDSLI